MSVTEEVRPGDKKVVSQVRFDPFLYHVEMPLAAVYYPLGFPLELVTNSVDVMRAADESWGNFHKQFDTPPLRLNLGVLDDKSAECPGALISRGQRGLMVQIADRSNFSVSDFLQGFTYGWVTNAAASHCGYLRYHFLESAALCQIANRYTAAIHGGCVELAGRGVLLCGDSGAGKSSLSYACARAGWTYITDDASYLVHGGSDRTVVGNCHIVRLRPSAAELFQEKFSEPITPRALGKPTIEILTSEAGGIACAPSTRVDYLVFLNRSSANSQDLIGYPKESARLHLQKHLSDVDEFRDWQIPMVEGLLDVECVELRYHDLNWAVGRLERLVAENA